MSNPEIKINWSTCDNSTIRTIEPLISFSNGNEKIIYVNVPDDIGPTYILNKLG